MSNKVKIGSGIVEAETANAEDLAKMDGAATAVAVCLVQDAQTGCAKNRYNI